MLRSPYLKDVVGDERGQGLGQFLGPHVPGQVVYHILLNRETPLTIHEPGKETDNQSISSLEMDQS